jgi:anthranilate phosphoribosyltransferase
MSKALTPETFKPLLSKLIKSPQTFTRDDVVQAMEHLLDPASTMPSQVGSFLTALHINGLERDSEILAGAAEVLRKHSILVETTHTQGRGNVVDIVGTGGDGHDTFNVSTTAAVIAAGAGARVHKARLSTLRSFRRPLFSFSTQCLNSG